MSIVYISTILSIKKGGLRFGPDFKIKYETKKKNIYIKYKNNIKKKKDNTTPYRQHKA